jgi:hypothetical protein
MTEAQKLKFRKNTKTEAFQEYLAKRNKQRKLNTKRSEVDKYGCSLKNMIDHKIIDIDDIPSLK